MSVSKISVDLATLPTSYPSLCIPRVFSNITWQRVKEVFADLGLGDIERVDMVRKENDKGEKFQRVFVHFRSWNTSDDAQAVREKVLSGDMIQIVYDDPWFWKVGMSKIAKPERDNRVSGRRDDRRRGRDYDDRRRGGDRGGYRRGRDFEDERDDRRGRDTRRSGGYREQRPRQHHRQVRGDSRKDYASSEIGQLKEMVAAQAQQMAMMQQMLMGGMGMSAQPHSPPLSPHSPPMTANDDQGPYSPPYPPMSPEVTETVEVTAPVKKRVIRKAPKITPKKLVLSDEDAPSAVSPAAASPATPTLE